MKNKTTKRTKKPGNLIGREDSAGSNPYWPGEGNQEAGTFPDDRGDTVNIPFVDSIAHKKNTTT